MSEMNEPIFIVCTTVQMGKWNPASITSGSVVKLCNKCGIDVYASKASQNVIAEKPDRVQLICTTCVQKLQSDLGDKVSFGGVVPGAFSEIMDHIKELKEKEEK